MIVEALLGLIFVPLAGACMMVVLPGRARWIPVLLTFVLLPIMVAVLTHGVSQEGWVTYELAGFAPPLGIRLVADPLSVILLWTATLVGVLAGIHALTDFAPHTAAGQRFWPLWLLLMSAISGALLSADLFNLYVTLELITLSAIALIAIPGDSEALRAAMRYLLFAMTASLVYLFGIGLIYARYGVLDIYQLSDLTSSDPSTLMALTLMTIGLLVKAAIFPLHVWLPAAHGNAPGPVSALLSGVVVKVAIYIIYRLWLWSGTGMPLQTAATFLGLLGAAAIIFGSLAAMFQQRLKMVVAYSTVGQLGYLLLVFPLGTAQAFRGAVYHILSHGPAKAALFLATANILHCLGTDRLRQLGRLDHELSLQWFIFGLASVSIMGLPPSGGFLAKWILLTAAWEQNGWGWMAVIIIGSLLAAAYTYRVLMLALFRPASGYEQPAQAYASTTASLSALLLAMVAIAVGFLSAPILALIDTGLPPVFTGSNS